MRVALLLVFAKRPRLLQRVTATFTRESLSYAFQLAADLLYLSLNGSFCLQNVTELILINQVRR
jgi:hypothetical protein